MQKSVSLVKQNLEGKKYSKVRGHSHYKGEYRDAVHSICNVKYSVSKKVPIVH